MPVMIPTAEEIEQRIYVRMQGRNVPLTDLSPISVLRILVREMAVEEYMRLWLGLLKMHEGSFIQTATGADLDRKLADYGLVRPGPTKATGYVRLVAGAGSQLILPGTVLKTMPLDPEEPVRRYAVQRNPETEHGEWNVAANTTVVVPVVAMEEGTAGNTAAGTIVDAETSLANIVEIKNDAPLGNGRDTATDDEFRTLFHGFLRGLQRGSRGSLLRACLDYVDPQTGLRPVHSAAIEEWNGSEMLVDNAAARIYVEDGSGQASPGLVEALQRLIDGTDVTENHGYRAAGCKVVVSSAFPYPINIAAEIDISSSVGTEKASRLVRDVISGHLMRLPVSGINLSGQITGHLIVSRLFRDVMDIPGIMRLAISNPVYDVYLPVGHKAIPGVISVSVVSVV